MPSFKDIRTKAERIFTAPHPDIKNPLSQRRARITSSMLLAVNLLYTIPEGIRAIFEHELPPYLLFFAFIFLVAYIISRTKYYQWGTRLMLLGLGVLVPIGVNFSPNFDPVHPELFLMWAVPAMILGALLLENAKQTLAYMVGLMLSLWFVLVLYPNTAIRAIIAVDGILLIIGTFSSIYSHILILLLERSQNAEAEARMLKRAIESTQSTVVITNTEGKIEYVNPAFTTSTGYTFEEVLGQNPRILKSGKHPAEFYTAMWDVITEKETWHGELLNKKKDGSLYWEDATISPILNEDGDITHYVAMKFDITARKTAEEKLRKMQRAAESSESGIVITDTEGVIEYVNPAFTSLTGYSFEEAIGKTPNILRSDYHPQSFYQELWKTIESGKTWKNELLNRRKDGSTYWEYQVISPIFDSEGKITHYVAIKHDISERKALEEELIESRQRAEESNRFKSRMLANVSHDMRTPLGAILGYAEMLRENVFGEVSEEQSEYLERIAKSARQLSEYIDNLIAQAQIESSKLVFSSHTFRLEEIQTFLSPFHEQAQSKGLEMRVEISPDMPETLFGDYKWLKHIFSNLVSNAVKFTDSGSVDILIAPVDDSRWRFSVKDTGEGIPPEEQENIFQPFQQGRNKRMKGSGLGLAIVQEIAEQMGGTVTLESEIGKGSTFTITLPYTMKKSGETA